MSSSKQTNLQHHNVIETDLAQKRETMELNKAVKKAVHDKILESFCEQKGLPICLAPYVKFNKCTISLSTKDSNDLMNLCRIIIKNQNDFALPQEKMLQEEMPQVANSIGQ
jgi:hypothetical protein